MNYNNLSLNSALYCLCSKKEGGGGVKSLINFRRVYMSLIQDKLKVYGLQLIVFHSHINEV